MSMRALVIFGTTALMSSAHAVVLVTDSFSYVANQFLNAQSGGGGFSNSWSSPAPYTISPTGLPGAGATGRAVAQTSQTRGTSQFAVASRNTVQTFGQTGTRLYGSFLFRQDVVGSPATAIDHDFGGFYLGNPSGARLYIGIGGNTGNSGQIVAGTFGNNMAESSTGVVVTQGTVYHVVFRIDFLAGNDQVRLFVNPTSPIEPAVGVLKGDLDLGTFNTLGFTANQRFTFDEIRFTSTYSEAVPEPATLAALGVGFFTMLRKRKRGHGS